MLSIPRCCVLAARTALCGPNISRVPKRLMSAARRRFYRSVGVAGADGQFEVSLDQRKLKTPGGRLLQLPSRPLALAVAHEWETVAEHIQTSQMHVTGLCFTVLDNPHRRTDVDLARKIAGYLDTDTVLFPVELPAELAEIQRREWGAVLQWLRHRFDVAIEPSEPGSLVSTVPPETAETLQRYLSTHNTWALTGLLFAIEAVRSTVLPLAALERKLSPQEVVRLSRLEADYQARVWGRVEWAHDVDCLDTEARVSAGLLLAHLCTATSHSVRQKERSA
ncbi:ATP synthase mitochondrial F1 complex assembly factor 2-like [Pollicipes pollicipes]|uniref:ATP synthase mitochondrial F1 complex assembly factor 2-like n=1 Tax=Pollicipes pollicipes TaxID=41117 RepID=UPI00188519F7|nr:ATP synthase mitochondrial F1 complex assembly factor 2-like [Pollicipes pollicipes]